MKGETETTERGIAGANPDRAPSRLAARGTLQSVGNARSLSVARMLRPGTGRGPTEDNGPASSARIPAVGHCKSKI
jgi:hypothetical protein